MAIEKQGSPEDILEVAKSNEALKNLRERIAKSNNLLRCTRCDKLLAKQENNIVDVQHRKLVIIGQGPMVIVCPKCGQQLAIK